MVPEPRGIGARLPAAVIDELRTVVRRTAIDLDAEHASLFIFANEDEPVQRLVRFHGAGRRFEPMAVHSPRLAREARAFFSQISRAEVGDLREQLPPPGALGDYLHDTGVRGLLSIPIRLGGAVSGFVSFETTSGPRDWSEHDRQDAQALGARIERILEEALASGTAPAASPASKRALGQPAPDGASGDAAASAPDPSREERRTADRARATTARPPEPSAHAHVHEMRLPRLRVLERAALLGADVGDELLDLVEVHDGLLRLLEEEGIGSGAREIVDDLQEISSALRQGLSSLVDPARSEVQLREIAELGDVLGPLVQRLAAVAGPDVQFLVRPSSDPLPVRIDPLLLGRALEHLVRRARHELPPEGRIRVSWDRHHVSDRKDSGSRIDSGELDVARIRVEDDGPGIPPERLPWIFEHAYSEGADLPVVQAVVEAHGGWIDVHSRLGRGTGISLHLPLASAETMRKDGSRDSRPTGEQTRAEAPTPALALVVEGRPERARFLERTLSRGGFSVRVVASVSEAERLVLGSDGEEGARVEGGVGGPVRLAVVARRLEDGGDGLALLRRLKEKRPALATVLLEGRSDGSEVKSHDPLIDLRMRPPFAPAELLRLARERLLELDAEPDERPRLDPGSSAPGLPPGIGGTAH